MNMCDLGFGTLVSGIFKGLVSHCLAAGNENVGFEPQTWFQGLVSHHLAATGHQKIQPQEMKIWGLGLRNCFREFSGTRVPLSGSSRPPKNPATGNENLGLGWQNCFREFSKTCVPLSGRSRPPKIQPKEMRI